MKSCEAAGGGDQLRGDGGSCRPEPTKGNVGSEEADAKWDTTMHAGCRWHPN